MNILFMNIYGILGGVCLICAVMAGVRRNWERVQLLVIAIPFLSIGFITNYWAESWPEVFSQMLNFSF